MLILEWVEFTTGEDFPVLLSIPKATSYSDWYKKKSDPQEKTLISIKGFGLPWRELGQPLEVDGEEKKIPINDEVLS